MTPVFEPRRKVLALIPTLTRDAALIVLAAAEALASESSDSHEADRYILAGDRISVMIESPRIPRERLLQASPALIDRSGQRRTLIEMIEAESGDKPHRLRLAKLLFRSLIWLPETFPHAPA